MSTEAARPRPRPRPRPVARPSANSSNDSGAGPSTSNVVDRSSPALKPEDEDDLFRRPQRTLQQWKAIEQKERKSQKANNTIEVSDDEDASSSPRSRKTKKKSKTDSGWTNKNLQKLYLSSDSSDKDSDDDDALQIIDNTPNGTRAAKAAGKRKRSRSKSITPPPPLPQYQLQHARNVVRQALQSEPRAASPTWIGDDSLDTIALDPELAKIAREARAKPQVKATEEEEKRGGGPEEVLIKVKWQPHPKDDAARAPTQWGFKMKRHDNFKQLFEECADMAGILSQSLVVSYDGKRIFSHVTPHSIRIWAEAELQACDKITHEYIRAHRHSPSPSREPQGTNPNGGPGGAGTGGPSRLGTQDLSDSETEAATQSQDDTFKLVLRSARTEKDITLTVRPATTCGAIVKAFLKKAGLSDKYKKGGPCLMVDGDKMSASSEIADADLDDGDMVEVVGL